ncbi:restriction endonuclease subunit S [Endozoicomonas sp. ALB032]|uniref:restriction endonuclease subunit S n=1 Tax=Endozoicomonas sp. ALB032 TaxID=3403082 RepID=UPI003BB79EA1
MSSSMLPDGWIACELSDLGNVVTGKTPSTKVKDNFGGNIPFIKPGDLDHGGVIKQTANTLSEAGLQSVPAIPANSIPVTCIGNLGKVGITTQLSATNQQINTLIPHADLNTKYLYYQACTIKPWLESESSATTVAIINKGRFSKAPISLAPLTEQKIIAQKLDTLLAQIESTKARLERTRETLKRFRQSVLIAAVSGKLTKAWRSNHPEFTTEKMLTNHVPLKKPARWKSRSEQFIMGVCATSVGLPQENIVPTWEWVPIVDVAAMESGHTPSRSKPEYWGGDVCWIGIKDARNNHAGTIQNTEQKTNDLGLANSASRLLPKNTVCISRTASVGYVVKMGKSMATSQDFVNWVPAAVINPDWLKWLFVAEKESLFKFGKGSTHTTIYFPEWLAMHIALPPLEEQTEIVRRVEHLFTHANTIEKQTESALAKVNNLTQSILAKAFRGELTAQWRAENPELISGENSAEALLAKIKAERATLTTKKGGKPRTPKAWKTAGA